MNGINEVLLLGTVGSDPETRMLNENARVTTFRLATNDSYTDKSGVKKESTEWHSIEAWGLLSDAVANYVKKGTHLIVRGKIKTDTYDDKEVQGRKLSKTKIVMDGLNFLPGGKKDEQPVQQQQPGQYQQPVQQPAYQQPEQYQQPIQQPAYQQPGQYQQPVQQPAYQQPAYQQPAYQQPVQQPAYQQPVQQPAYQQPAQQPAQQAQNQVGQYMTDKQFISNMNGGNGADDLPF